MVGPKQIVAGATDVSVVIHIVDSGDGTPETGVNAAAAGLVLNYRRDLAANVSLATITDLAALTTAHTDKGMIHIGNGYYRVDVPDAAFAVGVDKVQIHGTATGMKVYGPVIELADPAANLFKSSAIDASGHTTSNLRVSAFASFGSDELNGELWWAYDSSEDEWHLVEVVDWDTTNNDATVRLATNRAVLPFTPEASVDRVARSGLNLRAMWAAELGTQAKADIAASPVASVTGAVGSVTGAVGSVTGAVGSVTGAVGSVAAGGITAASIATGAVDADALAADAVTEIQSGLATAANLATVAGYLDTEIQEILEDTGTDIPALIAALNNLDAAGVRSALGLASANLDTQLTALAAQRSVPTKGAAFTFSFKMVDAIDFATPETGLTVTATRSIDGAAFGAATGTVTEISAGIYRFAASAADMNGNTIDFKFAAAGAATGFVSVITDGGV